MTQKILTGAQTEHWLDKAKREKTPWTTKERNKRQIACPGNHIRISAEALVKMQTIRNKGQKKKLSLIEQQRQWEKEHPEEV